MRFISRLHRSTPSTTIAKKGPQTAMTAMTGGTRTITVMVKITKTEPSWKRLSIQKLKYRSTAARSDENRDVMRPTGVSRNQKNGAKRSCEMHWACNVLLTRSPAKQNPYDPMSTPIARISTADPYLHHNRAPQQTHTRQSLTPTDPNHRSITTVSQSKRERIKGSCSIRTPTRTERLRFGTARRLLAFLILAPTRQAEYQPQPHQLRTTRK